MAMFSSKSNAQPPPPGGQIGEPAAPRTLTGEEAKKFEEAAEHRAAIYGRILALLSVSARHSKLTLRELNALLTPAIALGQFAMISGSADKGGPTALAGVAWWALVSPEVDKRLSESTSEFLHVENSEWKGGDQPWIIEAVGDQRVVGELLKKLSERTFKTKPAKLRAMMPDGRIAVGRLEHKPTES